MPIPKVIYQTYKTTKLPFIFRWHISRLKKKNPNYDYQFYDDNRIDNFLLNEFGENIFKLYKCINIGAAKADFFRYAILYKKGGVYLDIDSRIINKIDTFINPEDRAVIAHEGNGNFFIQYALFFEAKHPILKKTLELAIENLLQNTYPNDTHKMTGPTVFTRAVKDCLQDANNSTLCRVLQKEYDGNLQFSFRASKTFLYGFSRKKHWKKQSESVPVIDSKAMKKLAGLPFEIE